MTQEEIAKFIKWEPFPLPKPIIGGQSIGRMIPGVTLIVEELGFKISIDYHKSQLKNKDEAYKMLIVFCDTNKIWNQ